MWMKITGLYFFVLDNLQAFFSKLLPIAEANMNMQYSYECKHTDGKSDESNCFR